jgi:hypothetical protein
MVVRNEADIIEVNLRYHRGIGVDEFLVIDNGSTDGTTEVLRRLARSMPLRWSVDAGPYDQSAMATGLAREAASHGATWVLPTDADEFWWSPNDLHVELAVEATAIRAPVVNFVQDRRQRRARTRALLRMAHRVEVAVGPPEDAERLVRTRRAGFVEIEYEPKWAVRPTETLVIHKGNHAVSGVSGPRVLDRSLQILHAPLRARTILRQMAEHGRRLAATDPARGEGWHALRWSEMSGRRELAIEWAANSSRRGTIDVAGRRRPLVRDERLVTAVAPYVRTRR